MSKDATEANASGTWAAGVQRINDQAAGTLHLHVIERGDAPEIVAYALLGDPEAVRLAQLVGQALRGISDAPRRRPMLCGCCPRPLRNGRFAIVVALPARDDAHEALALAICERCATGHDAVLRKAAGALRRIWPDFRPISVHPTGGRA